MKNINFFSQSILLIIILFLLTTHIYAFRFVVCSDCRAPKTDADKTFPNNLYNEPVLTFINNQITTLNPSPKFVIFLGDLVNFASPNGGPDKSVNNNLTYWKRFMEESLKGIPIYVCVGNSDLYGRTTWWTEEARQKEFTQVFSNMPINGPSTPVDFRNLVYSFEYGRNEEKTLFVVLDSFGIYGTGATAIHCDNDIDPYPYPSEQIDWFSNIAKDSKALKKFVFSHGPAFSVEGYPVAKSIKNVWDIAIENKFDVFFCAHEHLYYRWLIDKSAYPPTAGNLTQMLAGTSGAVPNSPTNIKANPDGRIYFGYHYVVVDVNTNNITMTTYGLTPYGTTYIAQPIDINTIIK